MIIIDCEVYKDYFLLAAKQLSTGKVRTFEMYDGHPPDLRGIHNILERRTTISFNGNNYDLIILAALMAGYDCAGLKKLSDKIIVGGKPGWLVANELNLTAHADWDHIDLFEVAPGRVSLKMYGARLGYPHLQDLPIEPDASITPAQRQVLIDYCGNDIGATEALYNDLRPQIELRERMSEQYGMDLRSKSDAQIAETVIISELAALTGKPVKRPNVDREVFRYIDPGIVAFKDPALQVMFERILETEFTLAGNGVIQLPKWLKDERIVINGREYQMGIGGLHSCEKAQYLAANKAMALCDLDVASYYPNIILQQSLAPSSLGKPFLDVYQSIVERRIAAKRSGDDVTAYTLKIAVNGSFGKLGSKYSKLYAPELLIQTTITGQLCLLMLIERMEAQGVRVMSANTDGIVCHYNRKLEAKVDWVGWDWMLDTSFELERNDYLRLASKDVNNYLAVVTPEKTKGKGVFASTGIAKNPDASIIAHAVAQCVAKGTPVEDTVRACDDPQQFVMCRKVAGGAMWQGEPLGKAVRFYWANDFDLATGITYARNGNQVPKSAGSRPLMDLTTFDRSSVDDDRYIMAARKLLGEVGM